jgi:hypothetical protein
MNIASEEPSLFARQLVSRLIMNLLFDRAGLSEILSAEQNGGEIIIKISE